MKKTEHLTAEGNVNIILTTRLVGKYFLKLFLGSVLERLMTPSISRLLVFAFSILLKTTQKTTRMLALGVTSAHSRRGSWLCKQTAYGTHALVCCAILVHFESAPLHSLPAHLS